MQKYFCISSERNIYVALLDAIDEAAKEFIGLPHLVIMNAHRRCTEIAPTYWHTIYHGPIPIRLRSPLDKDIPIEFQDIYCPPTLFICIQEHDT